MCVCERIQGGAFSVRFEVQFSSFQFMNVDVCVCLVQVQKGAGSQKKKARRV